MEKQELVKLLLSSAEEFNLFRREDLKSRHPVYREHYLDLRGINLAGKNLDRVNLADALLDEANFEKAQLIGADFSRSWLEGINFAGAELADANFFRARLRRANFHSAGLAHVSFEEAWCEDADFGDALLYNTTFIGANLLGANFHPLHRPLANFSRARGLRRAVFDEIIGILKNSIIFEEEGVERGDRLRERPSTLISERKLEMLEEFNRAFRRRG